jgi:hypothetical protein
MLSKKRINQQKSQQILEEFIVTRFGVLMFDKNFSIFKGNLHFLTA